MGYKLAIDIPKELIKLLQNLNYTLITPEEWKGIYALYNAYSKYIPIKNTIKLSNISVEADKEFVKLINAIDYNKIPKDILVFVIKYLTLNLKKYML